MLPENRYAFDIEVFKNFFCCTFVKVDKSDIQQFVIWKDTDDRYKLFKFLKTNPFLISFNGLSYDLPIIRYIRDYKGRNILSDISSLSSRLVSNKRNVDDEEIKSLRYPREFDYIHQDLMAMMNFVRNGVGLKQCAVNLRWHRIQDLPLKYDSLIDSYKDVELILDYNKNDTLITIELYNHPLVTEYRLLRENLVDEYGYEILSAAKSIMANIMMETMYERETGIPKKVFKTQRTNRDVIYFKDVIFPNVEFQSKELKDFHQRLLQVSVNAYDDYGFSESLFFKGNKYNIGIGGLHSDEKPAKYGSGNSEKIISMDVSSFYPAIMCEYNVKPEHLENEFIFILDRVRKERVAAKKSGDKIKAESYKILINSEFGKLRFPDYWLYDPLCLLKVTLNGQLFLLMLIEQMELAGMRCISANTDGCEILVPVGKEEVVSQLAKMWEKQTIMELEFNTYHLLVKKDVNNYIAVDEKGKVKEKGAAFLTEVNLEKGYKSPILAKAIRNYFTKNTPVEETIYKSQDILDFCISQKMGEGFVAELKENGKIQQLQKTNRFYVSIGGGEFQKRKEGSVTGLYVGKTVTILNDYDSSVKFEDYKVNKIFYIVEAKKIIELIEPSVTQISMFDNTLDFGKYINMAGQQVQKKKRKASLATMPISIEEIQNAKKKRLTYTIEGTVALVTELYTTYSPALTLYSLSLGKENKFKMKKDVFKEKPVNIGDVIHLKSVEKKPKVVKKDDEFVEVSGEWTFWINDFDIINNFSNFKRKLA